MQISSADLKIQSLHCTTHITQQSVRVVTEIIVHNHWDDDARDVMLIVLLPPTSRVLSASHQAMLRASYRDSTPWRTHGYVLFKLPPLGVGLTWTCRVESEMLATAIGSATRIGAYVFGSLPDPDVSNNYRSCRVPWEPRSVAAQ